MDGRRVANPALIAKCALCGTVLFDSREKFCCAGCALVFKAQGKGTSASNNGVVRDLIISTFLALNLMGVNLGYNAELKEGAAPRGVGWMSFVLSLAIVVLLGRTLFTDSLQAIRERRVAIEFPFLAGVVAAIAISLANLLSGAGPIYFETSGVLLVVYVLGKWVGARSRYQALEECRGQLCGSALPCKKVFQDGAISTISLEEIRTGDRIIVSPGQMIPADAIVEEGSSSVGEAIFTGEPLPRVAHKGDDVFAGTRAYDGELLIRILETGAATRLNSIFDRVRASVEVPGRWARQADRLVAWFFPSVTLVAVGTLLFWTMRSSIGVGLMNGLTVLLIACPCAMGLATPIVLWAAIGAFAKHGIGVQDPDSIERICEVDYVVFDKTGTLTEATLSSADVLIDPEMKRSFTLALFACLESATDHPYATLFQRFRDTRFSGRVIKITPLPGIGVSGVVDLNGEGYDLVIGNEGILSSVDDRERLKNWAETSLRADSVSSAVLLRLLYMKLSGRVVGIAFIRETPFAKSPSFFATLRMPVEILTGDPSRDTARLFKADNVSAIRFGLTPQEKADRVRELQRSGRRVLYVGDGVNDAPAMSIAHASVALANPFTLAGTCAGFTFTGKRIDALPILLQRSHEIRNVLRANLLWAAAYNILGTFVAALGLVEPIFAAVLMTGSSIFVSWRAHALRQRLLTGFSATLG